LSPHNTAKSGNQILDEHLATVCLLLRNEKICAINTYLSDVEMPSSFDQCKDSIFSGIFLERGATHNLVEEHLRTLDQQVSEEWDRKGRKKL
jgi:hypothetical protein